MNHLQAFGLDRRYDVSEVQSVRHGFSQAPIFVTTFYLNTICQDKAKASNHFPLSIPIPSSKLNETAVANRSCLLLYLWIKYEKFYDQMLYSFYFIEPIPYDFGCQFDSVLLMLSYPLSMLAFMHNSYSTFPREQIDQTNLLFHCKQMLCNTISKSDLKPSEGKRMQFTGFRAMKMLFTGSLSCSFQNPN